MDQWTTLQSLILAQLVHKYGDDNWNSVSKQLRTHPLTAMDPAHFTPKVSYRRDIQSMNCVPIIFISHGRRIANYTMHN